MENKVKLSKRLQAVADLVPQAARLADIGSDHAYLPTALCQAGQISFAVAGEVVTGPFEIAQAQVARLGLQEQIQVRLADGLAAIEGADAIDAVVIAGMGGILISQILAAGLDKLAGLQRLILQPNNHEPVLRQWLQDNGFKLVTERIVADAGKIYEILVAEQGLSNLTETDLAFGPYLRRDSSAIFQEKWQKELRTVRRILARLENQPQDAGVYAEFVAKKEKIEAVLGHENC